MLGTGFISPGHDQHEVGEGRDVLDVGGVLLGALVVDIGEEWLPRGTKGSGVRRACHVSPRELG